MSVVRGHKYLKSVIFQLGNSALDQLHECIELSCSVRNTAFLGGSYHPQVFAHCFIGLQGMRLLIPIISSVFDSNWEKSIQSKMEMMGIINTDAIIGLNPIIIDEMNLLLQCFNRHDY